MHKVFVILLVLVYNIGHSEEVVVYAGSSSVSYVEYPPCVDGYWAPLKLRVVYFHNNAIGSAKSVLGTIHHSVMNRMTYWPSQNYRCSVRRNMVHGNAEIYIRDQYIGSLGYSVGNIRSDAKITANNLGVAEGEDVGIWKILADQYRSKTLDFETYVKALEGAVISSDELTAEQLYHIGMAYRKFGEDHYGDYRDIAKGYFERSANLGFAPAMAVYIDTLGARSPFPTELRANLRNLNNGKTTSLTYKSRLPHYEKFNMALNQRVGVVYDHIKTFETFGIEYDGGRFVQQSNALPNIFNIEKGLMVSLSASTKILNSLIETSIQKALNTETKAFNYQCDEDWCYGFNKLFKFRFTPTRSPSCSDQIGKRTVCEFEFKMVSIVDVGTSNHPGNVISSALTTMAVMAGSAGFILENGVWNMDISTLELDR